MITNLISPIIKNDEALKGIRRARFSFHFNTARKRRWLLVQLVTAPTISAAEGDDQPYPAQLVRSQPKDYAHLLDDYQTNRLARMCV